MAECLRQIVPDRWDSVRKRSFTKCFCVYRVGAGVGVVRFVSITCQSRQCHWTSDRDIVVNNANPIDQLTSVSNLYPLHYHATTTLTTGAICLLTLGPLKALYLSDGS